MKYRVKKGKKFGSGGQFTAGMIIELSEEEASGFLDKLEPAPDNALVGSTQEVVPHEEPGFKNELDAEVPEDLKIMPGVINLADDTPEDLSVAEAAEEEKPQAPKSQRKTPSRSTRRGSHEG